jgi:hypothetical protein
MGGAAGDAWLLTTRCLTSMCPLVSRLEDDLECPGHAGDAGHVIFLWRAAFDLGQDPILVQQACAMSARR